MWPFSQKAKTETEVDKHSYFYAIDIGTEVLKVLLCQAKVSGVDILAIEKIPQQQKAMRAGVIKDLDIVAQNIRLAINKLKQKFMETQEFHIIREAMVDDGKTLEELESAYPDPSTTIIGIAGELIAGISIVVNYNREENSGKEISKDEVEIIKKKVLEQIQDQGVAEISRQLGFSDPKNVQILNITITGMEIDGNHVEDLEGFRGEDIAMYIYAAFSPVIYLDAINTLMKKLKLDLISIVPQPFSIIRAFSEEELSQNKIIFVDIGGGTTDIALARGTSIIDTKMIAFGGRVFTKRIAKDMNLDYRHAEMRKIKYSMGELDPILSRQVREVIRGDISLWVDSLSIGLQMIEDVDSYPDKIYLCGGGSLLTGLKEAVSTYPWRDKLPFRKHPLVKIVTPSVLDNVYDKSGDLRTAEDVTPASLARFAWDIAINSSKYIIL